MPKSKLVIISSEGARKTVSSPLLRFIRDYAVVLNDFEIHTTKGTGNAICASGIYNSETIKIHRSGPQGGVVELAAMVARHEVGTVIFLSDPLDVRSDVPENFALQRVCRELDNVRLINTLASAEEWALCGGAKRSPGRAPFPDNWVDNGHVNVEKNGDHHILPVKEQTIALISHDRKKDEMADFVNDHIEFLSLFHRILTTGTTGWLTKLLFATNKQKKNVEEEAQKRLGPLRYRELEVILWLTRWRHAEKDSKKDILEKAEYALGDNFKELQKRIVDLKETNLSLKPLKQPNPAFVDKVMPLPSGPKGGDIIIANEILDHKCHRVVFFIDPGTAHPHEPDIRLLERTCQIFGVHTVCTTDRETADNSMEELEEKLKQCSSLTLNPCMRRVLCDKYSLKDAVIIDSTNDVDGELLGKKLARACAGYLFQRLSIASTKQTPLRIGIPWGWAAKQVIDEIKQMESDGLVMRSSSQNNNLVWSTVMGNLTIDWSEHEAASIANEFRDFFGGEVEAFESSGLRRASATDLSSNDKALIEKLTEADIILMSGAPWNDKPSIFNSTFDKEKFPKVTDPEVAGNVLLNFLDNRGKEIKIGYKVGGLSIPELQKAAVKGSVMMMCAGEERHRIAYAALKSNLVSVLFTNNFTTEWLLKQ